MRAALTVILYLDQSYFQTLQKTSLRRHMRSHEGENRPYECDECEKVGSQISIGLPSANCQILFIMKR